MGMLAEIHVADGNVFWIVSEFPGKMRDVKWMAVEDRCNEARTPQELFHLIDTVHLHTRDGFLRPATRADCGHGSSHEGVFKVTDVPLFRSMPIWGWLEMVAFAKAA